MKKIIKNIWDVIFYPILYAAIQSVVVFIGAVVAGIFMTVNTGLLKEDTESNPIMASITENINFNLLLLVSILITLLLIYILQRKEGTAKDVYRLERIDFSTIGKLLILGIALNVFISAFISFTRISEIFPSYQELNSRITGGNLIIELLSIGLLGPILEEVIYRGIVMKRLLKKTKVPAAIILQGILFGVTHGNVLQGMQAFIMGCILGILFLWTKSLWSPIILHISYNTMAVISGRMIPQETEVTGIIWIGVIIITFLVSGAMLFFTRKQYIKPGEYASISWK